MTSLPAKLPLDHPQALPKLGADYTDSRGRMLIVQALVLDDPAGRQVQGHIYPAHDDLVRSRIYERAQYATDVKTWAAIWRDKQPEWEGTDMTVTVERSAREAHLMAQLRPPELRDLHPELYAAVAREATRIAAFEWRRRRVEESIRRARADIAGETFPCTLVREHSYYSHREGKRVVRPAHLTLSEHEPVVCTWMVDVAAGEGGLAPLEAIYTISREHHSSKWDWNHISRASVIGALRSNSCTGLVERAYPRVWRLTPLGRELMDVVFEA